MEKLLTVIATLLIISITANVSHSEGYWAKTYGGSLEDSAHSIKRTADGGYIIAGATGSFGAGGFDMWALKLNSTGDLVWQKTYGGGAKDYAGEVQQTTDGGYIIAGSTESFGAGGVDMWVLKLNSTGNVVWEKTYGGSAADYALSVQQTTDGDYVVAGLTNGSVCVLKLDGSGNVIWQNRYGGSDYDVNEIQQTSNGGIILAGSAIFSLNRYIVPWIMQLDSNGEIAWQKIYPGSETLGPEGYVSSIFQTADDGFLAVGGTDPYGLFDNDVLVLKLDQTGYLSWDRIYRGPSSASASSIQQTAQGDYIVGGYNGYRYVPGAFSWILKLTSSGTILWQKNYKGSGGDYFYSVLETENAGSIAVGRTESFGSGDFNVWILKVDDIGEIPYCDIVETGTVDALNTSHLPLNSGVSAQSIEFTVADVESVPEDTSAEISLICCHDPEDSEMDGIGDACDNCPDDINPGQEDHDLDEIGDVCDVCTDTDDDGYGNPGFPNNTCPLDNCSDVINPEQDDNSPPDGNGIGDACECEGNFDCDEDCDGTDAALFKSDFGRSAFLNPCMNEAQCKGDFDCDNDCDGTDAALFKVDFGRSGFLNPCPVCVVGDWCVYE